MKGGVGTADARDQPIGAGFGRRWALDSFATRRKAFLLILSAPAVLYVILVALWPLSQGVWYSFYDYSLLRPDRRTFIGLANYLTLFSDPEARTALTNTFVFTFFAVVVEFVLGLILALALWRDSRFNRFALAFILVPVSVTPLVAGLIFRALLTPDFGVLGYWAAAFDLSSQRGFLGDPATAMGAIVFIDVWQWTPLVTLILLAGLKALPSEVLEAAAVDGASHIDRFRLVVFPMLLPAVFLGAVFRTMDAFRVFDIIFAATQGGPGDTTNVLMVHAVKQGLQFFNIGFGAAISNLMIVCIIILSLGFMLLIRRADQRINT